VFFCEGYALLLFFVLFVVVVKKFSGKKNRDNNYKGKSKNSGKLQKL
jgi:hypothetical protein